MPFSNTYPNRGRGAVRTQETLCRKLNWLLFSMYYRRLLDETLSLSALEANLNKKEKEANTCIHLTCMNLYKY